MSKTQVQQSQIRGSLEKLDNLTIDNTLAPQADLQGDLNALRTLIKDIKGEGNWDEAAVQDLAQIADAMVATGANAQFQGDVEVLGALSVDGNVTLGDSSSDTITFTAKAASDLAMDSHKVSGLQQASTAGDALAWGQDASVSDLIVTAGDFTVSEAGEVVAAELKISGDSAAAGQLYLVGAGGEIAEEADLSYDGSKLSVAGDLDVSGVVDLSAAGSATSVRGTLSVAEASTFDAAVQITAGGLDIDAGGLNIDAGGATIAGDELLLEAADITVKDATGGATKFSVEAASGNTDVQGTLAVAGESTLASAIVSDLTSGRVVLAGASGALQDDVKLQYSVDGAGAFELALDGALDMEGDLSVGDEFSVNAANGSMSVAGGELQVDDEGSLSIANGLFSVTATDGSVYAAGNLGVGVSFSVVAADGSMSAAGGNFDVSSAGALDMEGNLDVGDSFSVTAADGSMSAAGGLFAVAADGSMSAADGLFAVAADGSMSAADGLFAVDAEGDLSMGDGTTTKFSVAADSGNVSAAGTLSVTGNATFSSDVTVVGDLKVQGNMTNIDTVNLKVKDAMIHLNIAEDNSVGGASALTDRGIVFHGDSTGAGGYDALGFGVKKGSPDFIFARELGADSAAVGLVNPANGEHDVLGSSTLASAWMQGLKLGAAEGTLKGMLAYDSGDVVVRLSSSTDNLELRSAADLMLAAHGDSWSLSAGGASDDASAWTTQFPSDPSIIEAIISLAAGGSIEKGEVSHAAALVAAGTAIDFAADLGFKIRAASVGTAAEEKAIDVYLNGVRLLRGAGKDFEVFSAEEIKLSMDLQDEDVLYVVLYNPEAV
jgi:hypothetical protein